MEMNYAGSSRCFVYIYVDHYLTMHVFLLPAHEAERLCPQPPRHRRRPRRGPRPPHGHLRPDPEPGVPTRLRSRDPGAQGAADHRGKVPEPGRAAPEARVLLQALRDTRPLQEGEAR